MGKIRRRKGFPPNRMVGLRSQRDRPVERDNFPSGHFEFRFPGQQLNIRPPDGTDQDQTLLRPLEASSRARSRAGTGFERAHRPPLPFLAAKCPPRIRLARTGRRENPRQGRLWKSRPPRPPPEGKFRQNHDASPPALCPADATKPPSADWQWRFQFLPRSRFGRSSEAQHGRPHSPPLRRRVPRLARR
jgi:hypothetical protein